DALPISLAAIRQARPRGPGPRISTFSPGCSAGSSTAHVYPVARGWTKVATSAGTSSVTGWSRALGSMYTYSAMPPQSPGGSDEGIIPYALAGFRPEQVERLSLHRAQIPQRIRGSITTRVPTG